MEIIEGLGLGLGGADLELAEARVGGHRRRELLAFVRELEFEGHLGRRML